MTRPATTADAEAIARIHVRTWRVAYRGIIPEEFLSKLSEEKRAAGWRRNLAEGRTTVLLAEEAGEVTGWVSGGLSRDPDGNGDVEVHALYVSAQHWGRGLGRDLIAALEAALPPARTQRCGCWRPTNAPSAFTRGSATIPTAGGSKSNSAA